MVKKAKFQTKEEWIEYGLKKGYDKKEQKYLRNSDDTREKAWYYKGSREKWVKEFEFNNKYKTKKEWIKYGIQRGYENKNSHSFISSEIITERSWYNKGSRNKWLSSFNFKRKHELPLEEIKEIKTKEQWIVYGKIHGYEERKKISLIESESLSERSWYAKGNRNKWIKDFNFSLKRNNTNDSELENLLENYAGEKNDKSR